MKMEHEIRAPADGAVGVGFQQVLVLLGLPHQGSPAGCLQIAGHVLVVGKDGAGGS